MGQHAHIDVEGTWRLLSGKPARPDHLGCGAAAVVAAAIIDNLFAVAVAASVAAKDTTAFWPPLSSLLILRAEMEIVLMDPLLELVRLPAISR